MGKDHNPSIQSIMISVFSSRDNGLRTAFTDEDNALTSKARHLTPNSELTVKALNSEQYCSVHVPSELSSLAALCAYDLYEVA